MVETLRLLTMEMAGVMMADKWKKISELDRPMLHVFKNEKVLVISTA
jgi:hypothetical protein